MPAPQVEPAQLKALSASVRAYTLAKAENRKYFTLDVRLSDTERSKPLDIPCPNHLGILYGTQTRGTQNMVSYTIIFPGFSNLAAGLTVWIKNSQGKTAEALVAALASGIDKLAAQPQTVVQQVVL
ncbi:uncharacterized protein PHACADRAFT_209929 [Phanerochaete carnosa HHB-10118-sp]|uniref:Uncharacterized protein n=1 Tax=Phanerochaete carnosa (strain HHB-10118-sp) TaxID=650164 RepID=K5VRH8_PHACS|nr:uncharacterized protein PHACADRAFT_209929 [Phanerochaete carnosa HHB-10118-sp]EKM54108.1 hypothetical protein PHACADRAFT_209929 [Phanerochaete carnosa HHB-10118-sp]